MHIYIHIYIGLHTHIDMYMHRDRCDGETGARAMTDMCISITLTP